MRKSVLLLFTFTFIFQIKSQITSILPSSISIANTSVADTKNWSVFGNPSNIGNIESLEVASQFENRFIIPELSTKSFQVALPTKLLNAGLSFSHFGYSQYHEMLIGIGFARNFSGKFAMGLQFNYYTAYSVATNSYSGAFLPQFGLSVKLSPNFNLGFQSFNPFQSNIQTDFITKRLPSIFSLGTEYSFTPELVWRTQIDKELSSNYRFATGFEYQMLEKFSVKLGAYGTDYLIPCLGVGFNVGRLGLNLNCELHPLLGLNTMAAINYRFETSK
jgi:hypothetical protein